MCHAPSKCGVKLHEPKIILKQQSDRLYQLPVMMPAVQHMTKCANLDPRLCQVAKVIKTNYCAAHFKLPVRKYWIVFQCNSTGHIAVYVKSMLVQ
jgi:hypothetical protein